MLSSLKLMDLRQIKGAYAVRSIFAISSSLNSRALPRLSLAMKSNAAFNSWLKRTVRLTTIFPSRLLTFLVDRFQALRV